MTVLVRHARSRRTLGALALLVLALSACSSGKNASPTSESARSSTAPRSATTAAASQPFSAVVAVSEFVVGTNRFAVGVIDEQTKQPLPDAQVRFRFFTLKGDQGTLRSETDARFVAPARDAGVERVTEHRHPDGSIHPHANAATNIGVYVAQVQLDQPGQWGVQTVFRAQDGREGSINSGFMVLAQAKTPAVGQPAPRTRNLTARDVTDLSAIDSAVEPVPALHQDTVADAVAAGRPTLVGFVTPGYCATQFCGPTYELITKLVPKYGDKAALIHIEVYKDPVNRVPVEAFTEWKLTTEPVIYVIDRTGVITAKFEGPVGLAELDQALAQVTA